MNESKLQPAVSMKGVTKRFGRNTVLHDVQFEVLPGEVHVLAGENGAGKSTLIKILSGVHLDFDGTIELSGQPVRPQSPLDANRLGVAVIHQELSLIPSMSVADNLFLGRSPMTIGTRRSVIRQRFFTSKVGSLLAAIYMFPFRFPSTVKLPISR